MFEFCKYIDRTFVKNLTQNVIVNRSSVFAGLIFAINIDAQKLNRSDEIRTLTFYFSILLVENKLASLPVYSR